MKDRLYRIEAHIEIYLYFLQPNEDIMETVRNLKNHGITTAILTNNWKSETDGRLIFKENLELFDHVIESCLVGMRKPESKIYEHTLETIGVKGRAH